MVGQLHKPSERHQLVPTAATAAIGVGQRVGIGMGTRQRCEIGLLPIAARQLGRLFGHATNDIGKRDPLFQLLGQHIAARVGGGLEADARDPRPLGTELHEPAHLIFVHTGLQRANQRGSQACFAERLDRPQLGLGERLAAELLAGVVFKSVELKIDFRPMPVLGQLLDEGLVAGQPNAVGVDHHDVDRLIASVAKYLHELGMDSRLAAGELQNLGLAFDLDQPVNRPAAIARRKMHPARGAGGEAHWASEIARSGDLQ